MAGSMSVPPTCLCSSSSSASSKFKIFPKASTFHLSRLVPPLGLGHFSPWNGLKHLGFSVAPKSLKFERKRRCKNRVAYASLFGVGAPEALVIGVVALLVFGPKGLAEVARNLGKTLRAFQPTIKELQEVSREFKSTLEKEIGLDDVSGSTQNTDTYRTNTTSSPSSIATPEASKTTADPNGASPSRAYTTEDYLKITEEQLKASAAQQQGQTPSPAESQSETQTNPQATVETPSSQQSGRET
ncbi:hypothetical protein FNV43_RR24058 [Rhamnella rubrinervis]|uniref:Sec-independent protein translocase protein TATB, chloroplastic n=1 Tax=Rhamnella rubrinervis TaxID=2594499 RepID=A0A8K0GPW6_9ROSA|nr:hypothetical protein FNV43_RR24058 [Rhamnella rubrinervis]